MPQITDWEKHKTLLLQGLSEIKEKHHSLACRHNRLRTDHEVLKVRVYFLTAGISFTMSAAVGALIKWGFK